MAKVYERLLVYEHTTGKRRDSFDPQRVILLGKDIICMVNLLEIPRVIVFFIHHCLVSVVSEEKFCFVKQA